MDYNFQIDVASAQRVLTHCRPTLVPLHATTETALMTVATAVDEGDP